MRTVTHREMRNNSGEILRAVAAGETVRVTNNGRVAALIVPPPDDPIEDLIARGQARAAVRAPQGFAAIPRRTVGVPTSEIIRDLRGEW